MLEKSAFVRISLIVSRKKEQNILMETNRQKTDLRNRLNREEALKMLQAETTPRAVLTFYSYTRFVDPAALRDELFQSFADLRVFGRIYLAFEGINAQLSIPEDQVEELSRIMHALPGLSDMPIKRAVQDDPLAFWKLIIKVKSQIVADGLKDGSFDPSLVGTHLSAREWNLLMDDPDAVIVDMRNCYESEVGHFEGALCPPVATFRDELQMVPEMLEEQKDKKLLLYCTGGIRCEKASAWMKSKGFEKVYQLHGGIIDYVRQAKEENLPIRFKGKNFVFDDRLGERVTEDVISRCHICGSSSDMQTNCANDECHLLFITCPKCDQILKGHCSSECREYNLLSPEEKESLPQEKRRCRTQGHYVSDLPGSPHLQK